jgi:glycolate oxidase FAD binding subunit
MTPLIPAELPDLIAIVQEAVAARTPLKVTGGGTKDSLGNPRREVTTVSTERLRGIVDYDPAELVITVRAGTPLHEIEAVLREHGQMFAFEPSDLASICGGPEGKATIGGMVASGIAGPRRVSAGSVRDHVLGFSGVSGRGELFTAGGRVVKNVTGYDLPKLMCGSWGQLAALTEITLKVLPLPRTSVTLEVERLEVARAFEVMTQALRSTASVSAAAYLPARDGASSRTLLRLEGFGPSVDARAIALANTLRSSIRRVEMEESLALWSRLRDVKFFSPSAGPVIWRICIPTRSARALAEFAQTSGGEYWLDWGGALAWLSISSDVDPAAVRTLAERLGGHATLMNAPSEYRSRVPALHPEASGVAALSRRVREAFDPEGILDPKRFA